MKIVRYALYVKNPETNKFRLGGHNKTFKGLMKKIQSNLSFNPEWYDDEAGKRLKLRLVCEEQHGKKWEEIEEYKITKNWKVKGFFTNWEKFK